MHVSVERRPHALREDGYSLVIRDERELEALDEAVRAQVPSDVIALLIDPTRRLREIASSALHPCVARLVEGISERRAHIEIHVGEPMDPWSATDVIARLPRSPADEWAIGLRGVASLDRLPPSSPAALSSFYAHFGGLDLRYGWSPILYGPGAVRSVCDALAERGLQDDRAAGGALEGAYVFYEADGDLLCWLADGDAAWLGEEWVGDGDLHRRSNGASVLGEIFDHALLGERYHG